MQETRQARDNEKTEKKGRQRQRKEQVANDSRENETREARRG